MGKGMVWKGVLIGVVALATIVYLMPTLFEGASRWWPSPLPQEKIHLGLDLQGGMHLVLEVKAEKAVETALDQYATELREALSSGDGALATVTREGTENIKVTLLGQDSKNRYDRVINEQFRVLRTVSSRAEDNRFEELLTLVPREVDHIKESAVGQGLETIRNRIDQYGVAEPVVQRQGERRIIIQLPGIKDPERAIDLIGKTALLEFRLLDESMVPEQALERGIPAEDEILYQRIEDKETGRSRKVPYLVRKRAAITGEFLRDARMQIETQFSQAYVSLTFDSQGAKIFERVTGENVGRRLAIVLDGNVYSAPVIQERIGGGRAQITGLFSPDEAKDLAIVLRAGALPAPVDILEKRTVGPSLGRDSIRDGLTAIAFGGGAVIIFMFFYYRFAGGVANFALVFNLFLVAAALASLRATLTLPGLAGIVLSIGMAVDANVLIFERIREELKAGKTIRAAVAAGFSRAFLTILDSNITTLIAALFLFQFGTGPVKGFGVTLSIGLIASMFTAIFVARYIFDLVLSRRGVSGLGI